MVEHSNEIGEELKGIFGNGVEIIPAGPPPELSGQQILTWPGQMPAELQMRGILTFPGQEYLEVLRASPLLFELLADWVLECLYKPLTWPTTLGIQVPQYWTTTKGQSGAGRIIRQLTPNDLGIRGDVDLDATLSIDGDLAIVQVNMIQGTVENPFEAIQNLVELARAQGSTTLRVDATIVNERLYRILERRYGLVTEGAYDYFEIDID
jgi:hypothetical protein